MFNGVMACHKTLRDKYTKKDSLSLKCVCTCSTVKYYMALKLSAS